MNHKKRNSAITAGLLSLAALLVFAMLFKLASRTTPALGSGELADVSILREDDNDQGNRSPSPSPTETVTGTASPMPTTSPTNTPNGQEVPKTGDNELSLWLGLGGLCALVFCLAAWVRRARSVSAG